MDKSLKRKWILALRSGKYEQGTEKLKDCNGRFCCLGVLADIKHAKWQQMITNLNVFESQFNPTGNQYLSKPEENFGLTKEAMYMLSFLNDGSYQEDALNDPSFKKDARNIDHLHTFDEIADWIEKNVD